MIIQTVVFQIVTLCSRCMSTFRTNMLPPLRELDRSVRMQFDCTGRLHASGREGGSSMHSIPTGISKTENGYHSCLIFLSTPSLNYGPETVSCKFIDISEEPTTSIITLIYSVFFTYPPTSFHIHSFIYSVFQRSVKVDIELVIRIQ